MPDAMGGYRIVGDESGWITATPTTERDGVLLHISSRPIGTTVDAGALTEEPGTMPDPDGGEDLQLDVPRWEYVLDPDS